MSSAYRPRIFGQLSFANLSASCCAVAGVGSAAGEASIWRWNLPGRSVRHPLSIGGAIGFRLVRGPYWTGVSRTARPPWWTFVEAEGRGDHARVGDGNGLQVVRVPRQVDDKPFEAQHAEGVGVEEAAQLVGRIPRQSDDVTARVDRPAGAEGSTQGTQVLHAGGRGPAERAEVPLAPHGRMADHRPGGAQAAAVAPVRRVALGLDDAEVPHPVPGDEQERAVFAAGSP
jgi:hypothetical protein